MDESGGGRTVTAVRSQALEGPILRGPDGAHQPACCTQSLCSGAWGLQVHFHELHRAPAAEDPQETTRYPQSQKLQRTRGAQDQVG